MRRLVAQIPRPIKNILLTINYFHHAISNEVSTSLQFSKAEYKSINGNKS